MKGAAVAGEWEQQPGLFALAGTVFGGLCLYAAQAIMGKAAFQTAINQGFDRLCAQLQEENRVLREERNELIGETRNLKQTVRSLITMLRRQGVVDFPDDIRDRLKGEGIEDEAV